MKSCLFFISVSLALNAFSQRSSLEKLWVGNNNEYFIADSTVIRFETFSNQFGNIRIAKPYYLRNDTLKIVDELHKFAPTADFLIDTTHKNELSLTPINESAILLTNEITLTGAKTQLKFIGISQVYTDSIQFKKIIFNSTTCYGHCPSMTLEIDNSKHVRFIGQEFAVKEGFFYSTISDSLFDELNEILKVTELDKIECNKNHWPDLPTYTIEVYYNNKIKFLQSCRPPFVTDQLIKYLLKIPSKLKLNETKDKFDITFTDQ